MNNFEFIDVKFYPEDPYTDAVARVVVAGQVTHFGRKSSKDGGKFWARASFSVLDKGEKKYIRDYLNNTIQDEILLEFVKENVKRVTSTATPTQGSIQYPHGMGQTKPATAIPDFPPMSEVAPEAELPF